MNDKITTLNNSLTSGAIPFYFDNHDGKFVWNSDPARGADTFHPFSDGAEELYEALKYSGLVTEGMTFEEMCIALSERFPEEFLLYNAGNTETENSGGWGISNFGVSDDANTSKANFGAYNVSLIGGFKNSAYQGQSLIYTKKHWM